MHGSRLGWGIGGWFLLGAALAGCGDDGSGSAGATDSSSGSGSGGQQSTGTSLTPTTGDLPTTSVTDTTTAGSVSDSVSTTQGATDTLTTGSSQGTSGTGTSSAIDTSGTGNSSTGGDDLCLGGTLCGQVAECCPAGNECVDDRCLAACATGVRCGADLTTCCNAGDACLDATFAAQKTRRIPLSQPVPIFLDYRTAFVDDDGRLNLRNDLYGHDTDGTLLFTRKGLPPEPSPPVHPNSAPIMVREVPPLQAPAVPASIEPKSTAHDEGAAPS